MAKSFEFERDRAYARIINLIFGQEFKRDRALSERGLAEMFGMGRMPVREALRQLEQEGVVEVRPARGTFVRDINRDDLADIYRVREALECLGAECAAARDGKEDLHSIGTRMKVMVRDPDAFTAAEIDDAGTEFHECLIDAAGNPALAETIRLFRARFRLAFHLPRYFSEQTIHQTLREHLAIFEAVCAGDGTGAAALMRDHLRRGLDLRLKLKSAIDHSTTNPIEQQT